MSSDSCRPHSRDLEVPHNCEHNAWRHSFVSLEFFVCLIQIGSSLHVYLKSEFTWVIYLNLAIPLFQSAGIILKMKSVPTAALSYTCLYMTPALHKHGDHWYFFGLTVWARSAARIAHPWSLSHAVKICGLVTLVNPGVYWTECPSAHLPSDFHGCS